MQNQVLFWILVGSAAINVLLLIATAILFVAYRNFKKYRESQVRIWYHSVSGISFALDRILTHTWEESYSSTSDIANSVHIAEAAVMELMQSLYEEKDTREEDKHNDELLKKYQEEAENKVKPTKK